MSNNGPPAGAGPPDGQGQPDAQQGSPPYAPPVWLYGGIPGVIPDVVLCAMFLAAYFAAALIHHTVFIKNKKKGQKFVMSAMTFGFSMVRCVTFSTRLAWGLNPNNASLQLVSNVFLNAGIPILYIINLVFAHRITRAQHPRLGWHKSLSIGGRMLIASIFIVLILLIYSGVHSAYTRDEELLDILGYIQKFGAVWNNIIAFIPLPMLLIGVIIPKRVRTEKFGQGRFRTKIAVLLTSSTLLMLRATWGTVAMFQDPVPIRRDPLPWYYSKPVFYTVQLLTELIVVYMFIFVRINRIFYTPDGLPRGSYVSLPNTTNQTLGANPPPYGEHNFPTTTTLHVYSEEELFEERGALAETLRYSNTSLLMDDQSGKWKLNRQSDIYSPTETSRNSFQSYYNGGEGSRAPSLYTPSTWNRERYEKDRSRRGSTNSQKSSTSNYAAPKEKYRDDVKTHSRDWSQSSLPNKEQAEEHRLMDPVAPRSQPGSRRGSVSVNPARGMSGNFQAMVDQVMEDSSRHEGYDSRAYNEGRRSRSGSLTPANRISGTHSPHRVSGSHSPHRVSGSHSPQHRISSAPPMPTNLSSASLVEPIQAPERVRSTPRVEQREDFTGTVFHRVP